MMVQDLPLTETFKLRTGTFMESEEERNSSSSPKDGIMFKLIISTTTDQLL